MLFVFISWVSPHYWEGEQPDLLVTFVRRPNGREG